MADWDFGRGHGFVYRAQMRGWKLLFDEEIEVLAELPAQMNGAKRQF